MSFLSQCFRQCWRALSHRPMLAVVQTLLLLAIFLVILDAAHTIETIGKGRAKAGPAAATATSSGPATPSTNGQCFTVIF